MLGDLVANHSTLSVVLAHSCITLPQLYIYQPSAILRELRLSWILNKSLSSRTSY